MTRRVKREIKKQEIAVSHRRIVQLMRGEELQVQAKRKFKVTMDSNHDKPIAPDLLEREVTVDTPDTAYVGDITYISTSEDWLFLATVIHLFSRTVVG